MEEIKISEARAEELIKKIIEERENKKESKAYITGAKEELEKFLIQNNITEWTCPSGTVKISDSIREGLEKGKVESAVSKVNSKKIDHIEMSSLYKKINVHSISIKAAKEDI